MNAEDQLLLKWAEGTISLQEMEVLKETYDQESLDQFLANTRSMDIAVSDSEVMWDAISGRTVGRSSDHRSAISRRWIWLLICGLLAALAGYIYMQMSDHKVTNESTEPMYFALPDETKVSLAPGATIAYAQRGFKEERRVDLDGHAFFDVQQKGAFQVVTDQGVVSVLGTTFDVWEQGEDLMIVACHSGKVSVENQLGSTEIITAGQSARSSSNGVSVKDLAIDRKPAWLAGQLSYDDVQISKVLAELENFYNIDFEGNPSDITFSGTLPTRDISKVINILNAVTTDTYRMEGQKVFVSSSD